MQLLLTNALPSTLALRASVSPNIGRLLTPRHFSSAPETARQGITWAADNDGFGGFREEPFVAMLDSLAGVPGCRFITSPDVVCDDEQTLAMFATWGPEIRRRGFPVALVGQDGMTVDSVPWGSFDAFFVGGSTEWKLGDDARELVAAANARGLWSHMGRVNSASRCRIAHSFGCDSVDGSGWVRFKREMLPRWSRFEASVTADLAA